MSKEQVHEVMMDIYPEWRYHWCGSGGPCGCMGCSNVSGGVTLKGVTKKQWDEWVAANPKPDPVPEPVVDTRTSLQIKLVAYFAAGGSIR